MAKHRTSPRVTAQAGSILVETALVVAVLLPLIAGVIQTSRIFWHYNIAKIAARDAARYLSRLPASEVDDPIRMAQARTFASKMVSTAAAGAGVAIPVVAAVCVPQCRSTSMTTTTSGMQVTPTLNVNDTTFDYLDVDDEGNFYGAFTSSRPVKMRYIGA